MAVTFAINGFGRIGRLVLRAMVESGRDDVVPIAINGPGTAEANAPLFMYDSVYGRFHGQVETTETSMTVRAGDRTRGYGERGAGWRAAREGESDGHCGERE